MVFWFLTKAIFKSGFIFIRGNEALSVFLWDNFSKPYLDLIEIDQATLKFPADEFVTLVAMIDPMFNGTRSHWTALVYLLTNTRRSKYLQIGCESQNTCAIHRSRFVDFPGALQH